MIAITSISPGHKNFSNQQRAIFSWKEAGYNVVSLNSRAEIDALSSSFTGVEFVETSRTNEKIFGKPYVVVSAIIDHLKQVNCRHSLIINSDIIISENGNTERLRRDSENGIVVMNRIDFDGNRENTKLYESGFDAFFINEKFLGCFPQSILCLGQCFWDFWLPYTASHGGVDIIKLRDAYIYHERHNVQYSRHDWVRTGEIARAELGLFKFREASHVSNYMYKYIRAKLK